MNIRTDFNDHLYAITKIIEEESVCIETTDVYISISVGDYILYYEDYKDGINIAYYNDEDINFPPDLVAYIIGLLCEKLRLDTYIQAMNNNPHFTRSEKELIADDLYSDYEELVSDIPLYAANIYTTKKSINSLNRILKSCKVGKI